MSMDNKFSMSRMSVRYSRNCPSETGIQNSLWYYLVLVHVRVVHVPVHRYGRTAGTGTAYLESGYYFLKSTCSTAVLRSKSIPAHVPARGAQPRRTRACTAVPTLSS